MIQQRDKYSLGFVIKKDNVALTDDDVSEMIIKIGDKAKKYSEEEISYSEGKWLYPLSQDFTASLSGNVECQAQFTISGNIYNTPVQLIDVHQSIITEDDE